MLRSSLAMRAKKVAAGVVTVPCTVAVVLYFATVMMGGYLSHAGADVIVSTCWPNCGDLDYSTAACAARLIDHLLLITGMMLAA
jgi:hypothetical protein